MFNGGSRRARGRGRFGGLFSIFTMGNAIGSPTVKCFRFACENLTTFPFGKRIVGKLDSWFFGDIFSLKIKVGVDEKLAKE